MANTSVAPHTHHVAAGGDNVMIAYLLEVTL
jgi:hypothetical protein